MMNAERNPDQLNAPPGLASVVPLARRETDSAGALSALADGEIDPSELDTLLRAFGEQTDARATWHSYQVIGDVLRGSAPAAPLVSPQAFLAGVQARLQTEPRLPGPVSMPAHVRAPAANDALFRWKMVAGVASLAAVMAVSWSVLSSAPPAAGGGAGPQLALMQSPSVPVAADAQPSAVLVNTDQGTLIRDARLEELLAEHRQYGGMSALQMPAGFLRDATHDVAPMR
jgi:sigma-E factor negative regulatory protein RseA